MAKKRNLRIYQNEFISLYQEGKSIRQIATSYKVNKNSVSSLIQEKIELRPKSSITEELGESIYTDYSAGLSVRGISKKYNIAATSIQRHLTKHYGIKFYGNKGYEHLISDFITCYEEGMSLNDIAEKFNVSKQTILNYLNENDKNARSYKESGLKFEVDSQYFNELNSTKAYELGMLFYMTTITKSSGRQEFLNIKTNVSNKDTLLEAVRNFTSKNESNIEYTSKDGKITTAAIRIFEENLIKTLKEYGLVKGLLLNINKEYIGEFFKGYLRLALSITQKTISISVKNIHQNEIMDYLTCFVETNLIRQTKNALIIGSIEGSIKFFNNNKELIYKVEDYIQHNDSLDGWYKKRWQKIIEIRKK